MLLSATVATHLKNSVRTLTLLGMRARQTIIQVNLCVNYSSSDFNLGDKYDYFAVTLAPWDSALESDR